MTEIEKAYVEALQSVAEMLDMTMTYDTRRGMARAVRAIHGRLADTAELNRVRVNVQCTGYIKTIRIGDEIVYERVLNA